MDGQLYESLATVTDMILYQGELLFSGNVAGSVEGDELYKFSDGEVQLVANIEVTNGVGSKPDGFSIVDGRLYFDSYEECAGSPYRY